MKTVFEHIEYVKGKPHHIRRRVALSAAMFGSAFIALVWIAANSMTGAFAIQGSSFAMSTQGDGGIATTSAADTSALAGAAAALPNTSASASAPAHIEIVDTTPAPAAKKTDPTILPF